MLNSFTTMGLGRNEKLLPRPRRGNKENAQHLLDTVQKFMQLGRQMILWTDWISSCVIQYSKVLCQKLFVAVYTSIVT